MTNTQVKIWMAALEAHNKDGHAALADIAIIHDNSFEFLKSGMHEYIGKSRKFVIRDLCNKYYPDNKLRAVKEFQTIYPMGLKEAKELIDSMWE
jgi:ribosomal protein L7/L12